MRTPPPVLPSKSSNGDDYKRSLMDRLGPDGASEMRARVVAAMTFVGTFVVSASAAKYRPLTAAHPLLTGLAGGTIGSCLMYFMMSRMPASVGAAAGAITMPSGRTTPYEGQFSYEESLAARGDLPAALAAWEKLIADRPDAVIPRMRAAELYAARGGNPARAAELFRQVRGIEGVTRRDALYACSRLVDLYDGVLDEPGRAVVELRRIIELYPGTPVATHARDALPRMKARLALPSD